MQNALVRDLRSRVIRGAGGYIARAFTSQARQAYRSYQTGNFTQPSYRLRNYFMGSSAYRASGTGPTRRRGPVMRRRSGGFRTQRSYRRRTQTRAPPSGYGGFRGYRRRKYRKFYRRRRWY